MDATANGVVARLVGVEPPPSPEMSQEPFMITFLVIAAVGVLQAFGIARSVVLVRRWRAEQARRPHGVVGVGLRVGLPLVLNLTWAVIFLVILPPFFSLPLQTLLVVDVGRVVLLNAGFALVWGVVLRPLLALSALRAKGAPGDAGTPEKARVSVPT